IVTLIAASIALPLLLKMVPKIGGPHGYHHEQRLFALDYALGKAEQTLDQMVHDMTPEHLPTEIDMEALKEKLLDEFHQSFIVSMNATHEDYPTYLVEKRMRLKIISTMRESIYALARQRKISDEL